jgi:uncharacterized damage-inducible protein DinB
MESPPNLEPPGAGLPPVQAFFSRYFIFPLFSSTHPWKKSIEVFREEGFRLLDESVHLTPDQFTRRVVIPRLMGLEDSSRFWSVAMTLDHLTIVGRLVKEAIVLLGKGSVPPEPADTATVKPDPDAGLATIDHFRELIDDFTWAMQEKVEDRQSPTTYEHPWFGPLTARQWCALAAMHQMLHRRQIEAIIKRL